MKTFHILIPVLFIAFILCDEECDEAKKTSGEECKKIKVDFQSDGEKYTHCCYLDYTYKYEENGQKKEENEKYCIPISDKAYEDIDKYIKDAEKDAEEGIEGKINKLDCKSVYLTINLLSLLLFLL